MSRTALPQVGTAGRPWNLQDMRNPATTATRRPKKRSSSSAGGSRARRAASSPRSAGSTPSCHRRNRSMCAAGSASGSPDPVFGSTNRPIAAALCAIRAQQRRRPTEEERRIASYTSGHWERSFMMTLIKVLFGHFTAVQAGELVCCLQAYHRAGFSRLPATDVPSISHSCRSGRHRSSGGRRLLTNRTIGGGSGKLPRIETKTCLVFVQTA